ncbi:hypothetical protein DAPPUDRAFT_236069 [Daphnia pulex]|uniref:Uncharacterized protein n=1 Tax=Daphnia pulex TaxID=6669 RepID=E9FZW1_DAPPU|nr:hypothetical protein DAPPUDRAFT_236069 [Daphnia pulex]|eukprot:EFX87189.1 hypothetical protein DAPPUDRAFT_236069 [Daphnia pulex]
MKPDYERCRLSAYRRANNWNPAITETELTPIQAVQQLVRHHIVINPCKLREAIDSPRIPVKL